MNADRKCAPDCDERTDCPTVGGIGHWQCGRCVECGQPRHHGCLDGCSSARPADAGTPPSAPETSPAVPEAHSDDERVRKYADAISGTVYDPSMEPGYERRMPTARERAERAMAVADAEQAEWRAKVERLRTLADRVITVHEQVVMDTPEDRDLHDRACATFRAALDGDA